jgi:WS/DGAT/MGAT family acyltransferase
MSRPMNLLDLVFLLIERPETPSNVGVLMLFDPPPGLAPAAAANQVARAYRSTRPAPPFDAVPDLSVLALPRWRPAERLDPRRHVLRETLEAPGDTEELCRHVARLHEPLLERARPMFSVHVLDGLASGQFAVYVKSHHAYWDGRYALERIFGQLPAEPGKVAPPFFAGEDGDSHPSPGALTSTLATGLRSMVTQASAARELVTKLSAKARAGGSGSRGNRPFAGPHTRFNDPVSAERSFAAFSLRLDDMRRVARNCNATLNDVALAVVDAGVERMLAALGERPRQPLVAMCPVSLRAPGDHEATTKAATMFVPLARPRSGAVARLHEVAANTRAAKAEFKEFSHEAALDYAALAFGLWFASNALGLGAIARPVVNLTVSNVGAVEGSRYLGASRLVAAYPVSMLADPVGLNVTVLSVGDHMDFGLVANAAVLADGFELARACEAAFAQLLRSAKRAAGKRSTAGPRRP